MIPITTKEHLVYFMQCGMMRLSRYDLKFLQNLMTMTNQNKTLTTNQTELFEKLVKKYSRQLLKHGITATKLSTITWETKIISSDPQFTEAYISIHENTILFRSPFNKKFINKFAKTEPNSFKWNKEEKIYRSPYSANALKFLVNIAHEFYPKVNYCEATSNKITEFKKYDNGYWNPTLVKVNDYYLIAATNQYIDVAIKDITLSSDPRCLSMLAWFGIDIDPSIIDNNSLLQFSSKYLTEADVKDISTFIEYLINIGCNQVLIHGPGIVQVREKLQNANIQIKTNSFANSMVTEDCENTVLIVTRTLLQSSDSPLVSKGNYMKVVLLKNSSPIERL